MMEIREVRACSSLSALRAEPSSRAEQVSQAVPGEPLQMLRRERHWVRVRTAYAYEGWIAARALDARPSARWIVPDDGGDVLRQAEAYLGAPYLWGGMSRAGIDCSGLVHMAFRAIGRLVPRDAHEQEAAGHAVVADAVRPADVITYGEADIATHIAFWHPDGILHATDREGVHRVLIEAEPESLRAIRRGAYRLAGDA